MRLTRSRARCKLAAARIPDLGRRQLTVANQKLRSPESITDSPAEGGANPPDFERSLAELEAIVDKLEAGELSLDESLKQFERGVQLTRVCQSALKQAEQKVEILMRKSGTGDFAPAPFDAADDQES
jgi:exodeoxyribonuclease VII small subunit